MSHSIFLMSNRSFEEEDFTIPHSEPGSEDVFDKYPTEEESKDDSNRKFVYRVTEPLAKVRDQNYWGMDHKVEKGLSRVAELDQKLDKALSEIDGLKQEVCKEKTEKEQALRQRDQAVQDRNRALNKYRLMEEEKGKDKIIKKLESRITVLERDLKYEKDFAEKHGELYAKASEQLKKTTEKLKKELNGTK